MKKSRKKTTGTVPGSVIFTGERKIEDTLIQRLSYDDTQIRKTHTFSPITPEDHGVTWIDIRGIHDEKFVTQMGQNFALHPMILEDIVDVSQRPKLEEYKEALLFNLKSLTYIKDSNEIDYEHVSIIFKPNLIISMQEDQTDVFSHVRSRIEQSAGRVRSRSSSYLGYALIDNIVDHYYLVLEELDQELELIEQEIDQNTSEGTKKKLYDFRQKMVGFRKIVSPLRDATSKMLRLDHPALDETIQIYLRDLLDHILHILEQIESKREMVASLQDLYISEISFKMNSVMQVLTIISTIFIPLTFIAGIYGMNFTNMPELHSKYGYFSVWVVMILITVVLLLLFKRKKWL